MKCPEDDFTFPYTIVLGKSNNYIKGINEVTKQLGEAIKVVAEIITYLQGYTGQTF